MSASNNLSTNCSGLLLRSSFAILAARTRHLISVAQMAAFSIASRPSKSSDIPLADIFRAAPTAVGRACCAHQVQSFDLDQTFWCRGLWGIWPQPSKFFAEMNKTRGPSDYGMFGPKMWERERLLPLSQTGCGRSGLRPRPEV